MSKKLKNRLITDEKEYELIMEELKTNDRKYQNLVWQLLTIIVSIYALYFSNNSNYDNSLVLIVIFLPMVIEILTLFFVIQYDLVYREILKRKIILEKIIYKREINIKRMSGFVKCATIEIIIITTVSISFCIIQNLKLDSFYYIFYSILIIVMLIISLIAISKVDI